MIELVAEAYLPAPEEGIWYEWDRAGIYPSNYTGDGCINYIEEIDLVIRSKWSPANLIVSHLDGTEMRVLDDGAFGRPNYLDGWIYFMKLDGVWKVRIDGSEKHRIFEKEIDFFFTTLQIYDEKVYLLIDYTDKITCFGLEGEEIKKLNVPDSLAGYCFFSDGILYYNATNDGEDSIYQYDLDTGEASKVLPFEATGPIVVRNKMVYYINNGLLERTDGTTTETVLNDEKRTWASNYNLFNNYMVYFKNDYRNGSLDPGMLYALDVDTGKEYELFLIESDYPIDFYVMENSILLFSGFSNGSIYLITFEENLVKLWRLTGV